MKRIIFPVLGCLFVTFCFAEVQHVEVTKSISYDYDTSEGWLHITGSGAMPDYGKTSSSAPWNWLRGQIEEVTIDEGITSIGKYAFYEFKKMVSLTFPSTITKSGKDAFAYCTAQPNVFIDDLEAWLRVDWGTVSTSGISQPTMSGGYLYLDGDLLEDVYIPSSISTLRTNVFYKNYGIKNLYIPTSVTEIQEHATNLCMSLENIYYYGDIANWCKVKINSTTALYRKEGAKLWINDRLISGTLTIPSSVSKIGDHTFEYIQEINNLVIMDGVQTIGTSAFYMDGGLLSVELGRDCKQIGSYAFAGCSNLQKIVVKSVAPPTVSNNAFDNVSTSIPVIVPKGSLEKYKANTTWKKFANLQEESNSAQPQTIDYTPNWVEIKYYSQYDFHSLDMFIIDSDNTTQQLLRILFYPSEQQKISGFYSTQSGSIEINPNFDGYYTAVNSSWYDLESASFFVDFMRKDAYGDNVYKINGYCYLVDGREIDFSYENIVYPITAIYENGEWTYGDYILRDHTTPVDNIHIYNKATKILRNGQVLILRGNKTYTLQGQEVK